ncbi:hypothetical protein BMS3Bbin04_00252 [bacterium BMS3Bbin04]|nr:hypothetical protein BMS3Bbin04_00252 [bacterium BMS3Bbin04]
MFAEFFKAAVAVSDMGFALNDAFAIQLETVFENTVHRWMRRSHVEIVQIPLFVTLQFSDCAINDLFKHGRSPCRAWVHVAVPRECVVTLDLRALAWSSEIPQARDVCC